MVYLWMVPTGGDAQQTEPLGIIKKSARIAEEEENSSDVKADAHVQTTPTLSFTADQLAAIASAVALSMHQQQSSTQMMS
ncbi:hypothetical protein PsorP6_016621 [Peronosclerospora sorghi]|uniref:Uncharacterized protein n=1 Tax=Peronosclerospora sorghi TaxID=230839 RepID=A0ACC0VSZ9_9STRA|nr:hypothetical protein PsorP6_016621 [Peronosclerospora sorghi]